LRENQVLIEKRSDENRGQSLQGLSPINGGVGVGGQPETKQG
jgi:hypothetical protein